MKHRYPDRYIIIDTPPVLPFAETRLLGTLVDGVIFVVKEGGTSLENVSEAMESLKDANVMGTVYNDATLSSLNNGYGYYPYGYRNRGAAGLAAPGVNSKPGFIARFLKSKAGA
jgi:Mrp family chromosome partitioning ATPase